MRRSYYNKWKRIKRHLVALWRYATFYRLVNLVIVEMERMLGKTRLRGLPYILVVDPLNICNLKCPFCPTGQGTLPLKPGRMIFDEFKNLIDMTASHAIKLILYNWGEPFLHKDIVSMIRYAHQKRLATAISSHLNNLPPGCSAEDLVLSGLDDLIVSCDGLTQQSYEHYRKGGELSRVVQNIQSIVQAKRRLKRHSPVIEFQFLVFAHNEHEVPHVEEFGKKLGVDCVRLAKPYVNRESDEVKLPQNPDYVRSEYLKKGIPLSVHADIFNPLADRNLCVSLFQPPLQCFWPWRALVINWNGEVDPCCGKNYFGSFGNVFQKPLHEIWNNSLFQYARGWIKARVRNDPSFRIVCRGCPGYES